MGVYHIIVCKLEKSSPLLNNLFSPEVVYVLYLFPRSLCFISIYVIVMGIIIFTPHYVQCENTFILILNKLEKIKIPTKTFSHAWYPFQ